MSLKSYVQFLCFSEYTKNFNSSFINFIINIYSTVYFIIKIINIAILNQEFTKNKIIIQNNRINKITLSRL